MKTFFDIIKSLLIGCVCCVAVASAFIGIVCLFINYMWLFIGAFLLYCVCVMCWIVGEWVRGKRDLDSILNDKIYPDKPEWDVYS